MEKFLNTLSRGVVFVRNNPQVAYTLFLALAIMFAFFWTNQQFLKIAQQNQSSLEYGRISFLHDAFVLFAQDNMNNPESLSRGIAKISSENETMTSFRIVLPGEPSAEKKGVKEYSVVASMSSEELGTKISFSPFLDPSFASAAMDVHHTFHAQIFSQGGRYWESVRAIPKATSSEIMGYIVSDVSMAQADAVSRANINNAFIISIAIILSILLLLGRQARIIDYATLYGRLEEVDKMKDDFVSMAAHELRSPLTIIRGYTDMLGDEKLSDEGKGHLKNIDRSASQLNSLIGDILDVAKLQEGRMSFKNQPLDVSEAIAAVVDSFIKPAQDKGLALSYAKAPLPLILVDPDRFRQVAINLVGNAIKYTPKGEVRVTAQVEGERVSIRVSDTGMGISAEEQKNLFQKFYRIKNEETREITGTGLGLWITSQIVKQMQGTIAVESIKGKGTDFVISFPIVK